MDKTTAFAVSLLFLFSLLCFGCLRPVAKDLVGQSVFNNSQSSISQGIPVVAAAVLTAAPLEALAEIPVRPSEALSPAPPVQGGVKIRFSDYPRFNDWNVWRYTKYYHQVYGYYDFRKLVAKLNGFPNDEYYFRRIGLGRFPSGTIALPSLASGYFFDLGEPKVVAKSDKPAWLSQLSLAPLPDHRKETASQAELSITLGRVEDQLKQISDRIKSIELTIQGIKEKVKQMEDKQTAMAPISAITTSPKSAKAPFFWLGALSCGLVALAARYRQVVSKHQADLKQLQDELSALHDSISTYLTEFVIPADLYQEICGEQHRERLFFLRSYADSAEVIPLCGENTVKLKNMRNHLGHCPNCQLVLKTINTKARLQKALV